MGGSRCWAGGGGWDLGRARTQRRMWGFVGRNRCVFCPSPACWLVGGTFVHRSLTVLHGSFHSHLRHAAVLDQEAGGKNGSDNGFFV